MRRTAKTPNRMAGAALVLLWMFLFGAIVVGLIGPNRTAIEREFQLSSAQFGAGVAVLQILASVAVLGIVATRRKTVDSGTLFLSSLAQQAIGFGLVFSSPNMGMLALGWFCITSGTVTGGVANSVCANLWPQNPRLGVLLLHSFNALGKVAGPLLAAVCLPLGWRVSFLAMFAVNALLMIPFFLLRRDLRPDANAENLENTNDDVSQISPMRLLRRPAYWGLVLPFGLIAGGDVAFAALVPAFYQKQWNLSPQTASLLLTAHFVGLALFRFGFALAGRWLTNNQILRICLLCGVFVFPALWLKSLWAQAIGLALVGGLFSSTWPTYYDQIAPQFRAGERHLLDYGSQLGNALGIAVFVGVSSWLFDEWATGGVLVGVAATGLFGAIYFATPLSRAVEI